MQIPVHVIDSWKSKKRRNENVSMIQKTIKTHLFTIRNKCELSEGANYGLPAHKFDQ